MKQHFKVQRFFGTSENAVKSQSWVAVAVYILMAIIRNDLGIDLSSSRMMQTMAVVPFEQVSLHELFTESWPAASVSMCPERETDAAV